MAITKVVPNMFAVANGEIVSGVTVGNTTSIAALTFDESGVIVAASNVTVTVANTNITGTITNDQIASVASDKITGSIGSKQRFYTSPATWDKPAGLTLIKVTIQGSGGGGGGARGGGDTPNPEGAPINATSSGGGGGYGGGVIKYIPAPSIPGPVTVTVGAGGTAGPAPATFKSTSAGGTGGTSSFGPFCSVTGASGAVAGLTSPAPATFGSTGGGGSGGAASGGDINLNGFLGSTGSNFSSRDIRNGVTLGASTVFYNQGLVPAPSPIGDGVTAEIYGQGGSGGNSLGAGPTPAPTSTPRAGGAGAGGFIIVEEFY